MKTTITRKGVWLARHWGLCLGLVMGFGGLCLAAQGNMVAWKVYEQNTRMVGMNYTITTYLRSSEPAPGEAPREARFLGRLPDDHEMKSLGASLMLLGSTLLFMSANALKKEYERLEFTNWAIRESEFALTDYEYQQSVEVDRYAIDLQCQQQISDMLNPPADYYPEAFKNPQDDPKLKAEPEFSRTPTGFLAWLHQKAARVGNSFDLRWCCQQSFAGAKPTKAEVTAWIDELSAAQQTEWLDEEKKSFRLLQA